MTGYFVSLHTPCMMQTQGEGAFCFKTHLRVHGATIANLGAAAGALRTRAIGVGRAAVELGLELHRIGREHAGHGHRGSGRAAAAWHLRGSARGSIVLLLQLLPAHLPALCQRHIPAQITPFLST